MRYWAKASVIRATKKNGRSGGGGGGLFLLLIPFIKGNMDKAAGRSVFVGNIPYDATEEDLMGLFREVGPVVLRNLNGREFKGRTLRVDVADEKEHGGSNKRPREELILDLDACTIGELEETLIFVSQRGIQSGTMPREILYERIQEALALRANKRARRISAQAKLNVVQEALNAITAEEEEALEYGQQEHLKKAREACEAFWS
jgi:hypothetical protein